MPIQLGYVVMLVAMFFCFMLSKRQLKEMRFRVDKFAMAYLKMSNYVSPEPPRKKLAVDRYSEKGLQPLPMEQQPEEIRFILRRGDAEMMENLYQELEETADDIVAHSRRSRGLQIQFAKPISDLCFAASVFVKGCKDLNTIDTMDKEAAFNSFLNNQLKHRLALLKRISREASEEFYALNKNYDLAGALKAEKEKAMKGRAKPSVKKEE